MGTMSRAESALAPHDCTHGNWPWFSCFHKRFGRASYAIDGDFLPLRKLDAFFTPFLILPASSLRSVPAAASIALASSRAFDLRSSSRRFLRA
jgi:hypothetical protein